MKLFTPLSRDELERLRQLAQAERRRTQDQAAVLVVEGLARRDDETGRRRISREPCTSSDRADGPA